MNIRSITTEECFLCGRQMTFNKNRLGSMDIAFSDLKYKGSRRKRRIYFHKSCYDELPKVKLGGSRGS